MQQPPCRCRRDVFSPLGWLRLTAEDGRLVSLEWDDAAPKDVSALRPPVNDDVPVLREAAAQLEAYFAGELRAFSLPLRPEGRAHKRRIWTRLAAIPYGETVTYGALAAEVGSIARAVGTACGANPLPIVIPCHRVLASKGLGGFSAPGGLDSKRWLLRHEGAALPGAALEAARQPSLF